MNFFLFASGVSKEYLNECPESESIKYKTIGLVIILTAMFAFFSMFYAAYTTFLSMKIPISHVILYSIGIALLWSIFIFTIDRYFIISMTKSKNKLFEFLTSLSRIALAMLIGIIISKPLIVLIFSDNIDNSLYTTYINELKIKNSEFIIDIDNLNKRKSKDINESKQQQLIKIGEIDKLKTEIQNYEKEKKNYNELADNEIRGTGATGRPHCGTECKRYKSESERIGNTVKERQKKLNNLSSIKPKAKQFP